MAFFSQEYLDFFTELEQNNNKTWFDANRKTYETYVKQPFAEFFDALADELQRIYTHTDLRNNIHIMRINRDIRFSKDKTPYKIHMAGMISPHGKKVMDRPGVFVQANHKDVRLYSGIYQLSKEALQAIRQEIVYQPEKFSEIIQDKSFTSVFGEILGEKQKRLHKDLKETAEKQPLLYNKGFYYFFKEQPTLILKNDLCKILVDKYQVAIPLNSFFEIALDNF